LKGVLLSSCIGQESSNNKEEAFQPHHQVALVLGHAQVFEGREANGDKKTLSLPSWGIDYTYHLHPHWAIGVHTDIIVEKFEVKDGKNGDAIERSYPIAPALMGIYKPTEHWSFLLGMGAEFAKEDNFVLTRAGIEYGAEFSKNWEVFGSLSYDFKWNAYDTWLIGIGIAKAIGHHAREKK